MTNIDWSATGSMIAAVAALLGLAWQYFWVIGELRKEFSTASDKIQKNLDDTSEKITKELVEQGNRITRQETKMELFWGAVGGVMSSLIKQPIHFRKDELMDKLVPEALPKLPENSIDDLVELKGILNEELITLREIKDPKSIAYALALAYIDQILLDKGVLKGTEKK